MKLQICHIGYIMSLFLKFDTFRTLSVQNKLDTATFIAHSDLRFNIEFTHMYLKFALLRTIVTMT